MKVRRKFLTGGPISAASTAVDLHGDGQEIIITPADGLYAWTVEDGRLLPGFPVFGGNFFASQPLVVDLYGDGAPVIIAGCDDDCLYAFNFSGQILPGFPIRSGGDIYSSPVAGDLDGDGRLEIVHGSDDGCVYAWHGDGSILPGWPQQTGGFVSATPLLVDLDGDGRLEIVTGSWDGCVHAWKDDGSPLAGWPQKTGHFVWSTARAADLYGDGRLAIIAVSDRVYVWAADGSSLPGWPQPLGSYAVARPLVADFNGDGGQEILVAADGLYAWDLAGRRLPGFPKDWGTYFWSSPLLIPKGERTMPEVVVCGWDGRLYQLNADGSGGRAQLSGNPIFAAPTPLDCEINSPQRLLIGTWDNTLLEAALDLQPLTTHDGQAATLFPPAPTLKRVKASSAAFVSFPGPTDAQGQMFYRASFEKDWHPVPLVRHAGQLTGLFQPFPAGTAVSFWAQIKGRRVPAEGLYGYEVVRDFPGRVQRRIRRWAAAHPGVSRPR